MRGILLILLVMLAGCSGQPTYDELVDEALRTGDWDAVESREQLAQRKSRTNGQQCPDGALSVCRESGLSEDCDCVPLKGRRGP